MSLVPLTRFLTHIMPHVVNCPEPLALQETRMAITEWCERTRCWRHSTVAPVTQNPTIIDVPGYAAVHEIERARLDETELAPMQFSEVHWSAVASEPGRGRAAFISQANAGEVIVAPFQTGTLHLDLFLKPRAGTQYGATAEGSEQSAQNVVPGHIFAQSLDCIVNGALARIHAVPGQSWTNMDLASYRRTQFIQSADHHAARFMRGQQRTPLRTIPGWF